MSGAFEKLSSISRRFLSLADGWRRLAAALVLVFVPVVILLSTAAAGIFAAPLPAGADPRSASPVHRSQVRAGPGVAGAARLSRLDAARLVLLAEIRRCLGKPYAWGAAGPGCFDCSGLILWLYRRVGIRLPRVAVEQGRVGIRVPDRLRFGDVLLFKRDGPGWHIGFYLARGHFVHAASRSEGVIISSLAEGKYRRMFRDARRYMGTEDGARAPAGRPGTARG